MNHSDNEPYWINFRAYILEEIARQRDLIGVPSAHTRAKARALQIRANLIEQCMPPEKEV